MTAVRSHSWGRARDLALSAEMLLSLSHAEEAYRARTPSLQEGTKTVPSARIRKEGIRAGTGRGMGPYMKLLGGPGPHANICGCVASSLPLASERRVCANPPTSTRAHLHLHSSM